LDIRKRASQPSAKNLAHPSGCMWDAGSGAMPMAR